MIFSFLHPTLTIFKGVNYGSSSVNNIKIPKVLFVGISNYFSDPKSISVGEEWYWKTDADLGLIGDRQELKDIDVNSRINVIINNQDQQYPYERYKDIGDIFGRVFSLGGYANALNYIAFTNYYLRPANYSNPPKSLSPRDIDKGIAYCNLMYWYEILKPDLVILLGKGIYESFMEYHISCKFVLTPKSIPSFYKGDHNAMIDLENFLNIWKSKNP
jgi:hypothetical protein